MTRLRIAIAIALSVVATTTHAQTMHFTVNEPSASVYKAPTNVSPVIGEARHGATLEVTRDVGSWVKVAWSTSPEGVGYIRKSAGTIGALGAAAAATPASSATATAVAPAPVVRPQPKVVTQGYVAPSHRFGVGGQVGGSALGAGFTARGWSKSEKWGVQFDVMHTSMTNDVFFTTMSSTQAGPRVLYALRDHVSDTTWLRPYVGAGAHVLHASVNDPVTGLATSDTGMAAQFFGGTELTLAAVPRLGLSADVGYQWYQNPFAGYTLDGMMMTFSAHWYLK
jgi:hypothetical protein